MIARAPHRRRTTMQLDEILQGNEALLYMERYVDEGTKTYSPFAGKSEVALQYRPRTGRPSFELIGSRAPRDRVSIYEAVPDERLAKHYVRPDAVEFVVHPETWADRSVEHMDELHEFEQGEAVEVAPTASTRTVLTLRCPKEIPPHFIKLHYPRRIS